MDISFLSTCIYSYFFHVLFINSIPTETRCRGKVEKTQINVATNSKKRALVIKQEPFQPKRIN